MKAIKNDDISISPQTIGDYRDIDKPVMNEHTLAAIVEHVALRLTVLAARDYRERGENMVEIKLSDVTHEMDRVAEVATQAITQLSYERGGAPITTKDITERMGKLAKARTKKDGADK